MDEPWAAALAENHFDAAWDAFIGRYRRVIFSAIRHYAQDYDDVMEIFAHVCEALRADDFGPAGLLRPDEPGRPAVEPGTLTI